MLLNQFRSPDVCMIVVGCMIVSAVMIVLPDGSMWAANIKSLL
jgi:hypothetical protein